MTNRKRNYLSNITYFNFDKKSHFASTYTKNRKDSDASDN